MSLPGKLTSYFAAGRLILAAVHPDGATARELERAGAGVVSPAGEPQALLDALMGFARPGDAERMGARGVTKAEANAGRQRADAFVARVARRTAALRGAEA